MPALSELGCVRRKTHKMRTRFQHADQSPNTQDEYFAPATWKVGSIPQSDGRLPADFTATHSIVNGKLWTTLVKRQTLQVIEASSAASQALLWFKNTLLEQ